MTKLIREPLVHFILLGALLFAGHQIWSTIISKNDYTIYVSDAEIRRQAEIFASENQRQPSDEDIQALIFAHVEEQILMREAQRLGLEDDDTIIRRRLAQKMRFMINEDTPPKLPGDEELNTWFEANADKFVQPEQRAFTHVYFSPGEHESVEIAAQNALSMITDSNWKQMGDPFIESNQLPLTDKINVARRYGHNFAEKLFALDSSDKWQGPISSAYGMHLIRLDAITERKAPSFEQARDEISKAWQEETLRKNNEQRLIDLLQKYKVEVQETNP